MTSPTRATPHVLPPRLHAAHASTPALAPTRETCLRASGRPTGRVAHHDIARACATTMEHRVDDGRACPRGGRWRAMRACLLAACIAPLLVACGGSDGQATLAGTNPPASTPSPAPSAMPGACDLLDAAQVATVLGLPASRMSDDPRDCVWASQAHPARIAMMLVQSSEEASVDEAVSTYDAMVLAIGGTADAVGATAGRDGGGSLAGLGDAAWRRTSQVDAVGTQQLIARKGRRVLSLNVTGMRADDGLDERLARAAREALARM